MHVGFQIVFMDAQWNIADSTCSCEWVTKLLRWLLLLFNSSLVAMEMCKTEVVDVVGVSRYNMLLYRSYNDS